MKMLCCWVHSFAQIPSHPYLLMQSKTEVLHIHFMQGKLIITPDSRPIFRPYISNKFFFSFFAMYICTTILLLEFKGFGLLQLFFIKILKYLVCRILHTMTKHHMLRMNCTGIKICCNGPNGCHHRQYLVMHLISRQTICLANHVEITVKSEQVYIILT